MMEYKYRSKILIAGPTGTGTTFLLGLMHHMGFDTGYDNETVDKIVSGRGKGLEYVRANPTRKPWLDSREQGLDISPHVIKQPIQDYGDDGGTGEICDAVDIAAENGWDIQHMFLTVRSLTSVVESVERRMQTGDMVLFKIKGDGAKRQRELLAAEGFYKLMCKVAAGEIPHTVIEFPKTVDDPSYCGRQLMPVLRDSHILELKYAHKKIARKDMVHVR